MKKIRLLLLLLTAHVLAVAQTNMEDSLNKELSRATTVPARLYLMNKLGNYYTAIHTKQAEENEARMIALADSSRNREWMVRAYLYAAERNLMFDFLQQHISRGLQYAQKALSLAREANLQELSVWCYLSLARGALLNGENDKALNYNNIALSMATGLKSDSLQVYLFNGLGHIYRVKNEKLLAFRNYLQAMDIAAETNDYVLLRECYTNLGIFHATLNDIERSKDYLFKKEALQLEHKRYQELIVTYHEMGQLHIRAQDFDNSLKYFEKAIELANAIGYDQFLNRGYLSIINMYFISGQYEKGLDYFNTHSGVKDFMHQAGMDFLIDQSYGAMYTYLGRLDSAGYYMKRAEPGMVNNVNKNMKFWFFSQMGLYYKKLAAYDRSMEYWFRAKTVSEQLGDLDLQRMAAINIDSLYQMKGDFKNAYVYHVQQARLTDSLHKLSREKDLFSLEIDNENKRKEREALRQQAETQRRHNLQYMGITIGIALVFILLVMAGVFSVSKTTIKILGFFAFIFLFEFIILIADNKIHHMTHGEPWKVLAIKIGLIAILLPLHHRLEEKAIHYLTTQELLRIKGRGMIRKWFRKKDADLPMRNM